METPVLDPGDAEQAVDGPDFQTREVGDRRPEVGRPDRRQAEEAPRPGRVGHELTGVEPPHAVADQVERLAGERGVDLGREHARPPLHPGDRRDLGLEDAVARGAEDVRDAAEVRGQREPAVADPAEAEEAVGEDDRGV